MGSGGISGRVDGPVLRHRSTEPVPLGSDLRDLPPRLLCRLPPRCAAHGVRCDPPGVDSKLGPPERGPSSVKHDDTGPEPLPPRRVILMHYLYKWTPRCACGAERCETPQAEESQTDFDAQS